LELPKARRYIQDLINFQKKYSDDNRHIAKSLSNIGDYALEIYQKSFSLEMHQKATELFPEDNRAGLLWQIVIRH
jgi:hypothetical protein